MDNPHWHGFGEPTGGSNEKSVEKTPTRGLLGDVPQPEAAKTTGIFSIGGFFENVSADFFVRIVVLIGTCLCFRRARKREGKARDLELQRKLDHAHEVCRILESMVDVLSRDSRGAGTPPVVPVDSSTAQSSPAAPLQVPENHAQTTGPIPAGSLPEPSPQAASSKSAIPTTLTGSPTSSTNTVPAELKKAAPGGQLRYTNGYTSRSKSMGHASSTSSESKLVATPCSEDVAKEHHVIDIPFSCRFPSPRTKNKKANMFKETVKDRMGVAFDHDVCSSRTMEGRVPATKEEVRALREVAIEGMKLDERFTLQIGESFMYCCTGNPEEPVLLSLRDIKVPTILQAEYSAGMLIIRGRYLEGTQIRAVTAEGYMILESMKQDPIDNKVWMATLQSLPPEERIETWRCTDLLPPVKLNQIQLFAGKREDIEGQSVLVRSELCSIQNITLRTVIYNWVPTIILMIILTSQLWKILKLSSNLVTNLLNPWLSYPTLASTMYIIQLLSPRLEENVNYFIERLKLAISSLHVFPEALASPAFFMRNGFCFHRGAKYLMPPLQHEDDNKLGKDNKKKMKGNLVEKIDWKWPCWRFNGKSKKWEKLDSHSNEHGSKSSDDLPFEVFYGQGYCLIFDTSIEKSHKFVKSQQIPKDVVIRLHSKHLQNVVKECAPNNMKQFESYGEIQAMDLLIAHINEKFTRKNDDSSSTLPSISKDEDEDERNNLHMFHLTRFLEKEYAQIIKQYKRMMKAGIVSWDMLWTLIVPGIDVIYYCDISNQELCGKVSTLTYELVRDGPGKCSIGLEVYDFDCNNFVVGNVKRGVHFFKDDVKIINLDVFPLKCTANLQESEEFFFQRGKLFSDLVLKYERRFMHYSGQMYDTKIEGDTTSAAYRRHSGDSFKASIDGRVMIDQKWFAKLKSRRNMGTARVRGWNTINERSEIRIKANANEFDSLLKYSPAVAYGYSFSIRKWGCFNITGFSKIHFISTAFDKLVMKEEKKLALLTLTEYYINKTQGVNNLATQIDILPNKGQGCIIVLHGPPGTGKTLTVESLAERLECPLWQLSVSKLTSSTKQLENKVLSTFEVAKSWGAILVLDEADVYLSSRKYSPLSSNDTPYNAMTGVFLRVLEHYKGVLFLTTNVMDHIEPAIFSRISLFIKYEEFNAEERKKLWRNFLEESKISNLSEVFWKKILPTEFNGRVIRNIVQNAQILIQSKYFGTETPEECVLRVFDAMTSPSTMSYLVRSREADHSTPEVAPSLGSAPFVPSYISD